MLDVDDLLQTDHGRGVVNVLAADELIRAPKVYATFLLWMLSELFERLPEVGDPDKPTLVFFFDEAHLLFNDAPASLVEKIEQVVRLILTTRPRARHNAGVHMIRPVFSIVVPQCGIALSGELYMGVAA
jgi:DNA helicase HerA-like ATPase